MDKNPSRDDLLKRIEELESENKDLYLKLDNACKYYENELAQINVERFLRLNLIYLKNNGIFSYIYQVLRAIFRTFAMGFRRIKRIFKKNEVEIELKKILKENVGKKIMVFYPGYDWYMKMYQRPQHMALHFAEKDILFFYCTLNINDNVQGFEKIRENLYITDQFELLKSKLPKYTLYMCANMNGAFIPELQSILKKGNKLLYDYIDDLHEDLTKIDEQLLERHKFVLENSAIPIVATAQHLYNKAKAIRGNDKNILLSTNGVVYEDFHITSKLPIPEDMVNIVNEGKPIVGYYGALAKWFDYELVKKVAIKHKDWNIILIGIDYDNSFKKYNYFKDLDNVHYLGIKDYKDLIKYGNCCSVLTIPFLINEITLSTSPVKVFEYMSMEKPIVTTDLPECRKYKSVHIGKNHDEFIEELERCIKNKDNVKEKKILREEALANTWTKKVSEIIEFIEE